MTYSPFEYECYRDLVYRFSSPQERGGFLPSQHQFSQVSYLLIIYLCSLEYEAISLIWKSINVVLGVSDVGGHGCYQQKEPAR